LAAGVLLALLLFLGLLLKLTPADPWLVPKSWFFLVLGIVLVGVALEVYLWKQHCKIEGEGAADEQEESRKTSKRS
jgi:uncharacterized membrane protein YczE